MNKLIKELAQQAGLQPFEDCGPGYVAKMEKFAELIAEECAWQCDVLLSHTITKEWQRGTHECATQIRKHFRVEE